MSKIGEQKKSQELFDACYKFSVGFQISAVNDNKSVVRIAICVPANMNLTMSYVYVSFSVYVECMLKNFTIDNLRRKFSSINFIVRQWFYLLFWCGLWVFVGFSRLEIVLYLGAANTSSYLRRFCAYYCCCYTIIIIIVIIMIPVFECHNR